MSIAAAETAAWILSAKSSCVRDFYAELGVFLPDTGGEEATVSCFANPVAHRRADSDPSCSVNLSTGLWMCHGCSQCGNAFAAAVLLGRSEQRARELARQYGLFLEVQKPQERRLPTDPQLRRWRERLMGSPRILERLYELKGWTPQAVRACRVGWDGERERVVFQVREPRSKVRGLRTVGIVRYHPKPPVGVKKSKAEGKRSLFPPPEVLLRGEPLFVVEGEPAAVSVRSLGLQAVGIPGASSWRFEWAPRLAGFRRLIMLPDCDSQGRELAERVASMVPKLRVVDIEPSCQDGMDVGDWIAEAAGFGESASLRRLLERLAV